MTREEEVIKARFDARFKPNDVNTATTANILNEMKTNLQGKHVHELIQNADDAKAAGVQFILTNTHLIFTHQGKHFDEGDFNGISNAADPERDKVEDEGTIGNKGIGFKSVFSIASCVYIVSNNYQFRFDEDYEAWKSDSRRIPWTIIPIWTPIESIKADVPEANLSSSEVTFIFKLRATEQDQQEEEDDEDEKPPSIEEQLLDFLSNSKNFLFLKNIRKIGFHDRRSTEKEPVFIQTSMHVENTLFEDPEQGKEIKIKKVQTSQAIEEWYVLKINHVLSESIRKQMQADKNVVAKYKKMTSLPLSIAIRKADKKLLASEHPNVYCYLPTSIGWQLKSIFNGELFVESRRKELASGSAADKWNANLVTAFFELQFQLMAFLSTTEHWPQVLEFLSDPCDIAFGELEKKSKKQFAAAFEKNLVSDPIVKSLVDERLIPVTDAWSDERGFIKEFGSPTLKEKCIHPKVHIPDRCFKNWKINKFSLKNIIQEIKGKDFLETLKDPAVNQAFIRYLSELSSSLSHEDKKTLIAFLKETAFILSSTGKPCVPEDIYFPNASLNPLFEGLVDIDTLHPALLDVEIGKKIISFLKSIGVDDLTFDITIKKVNESTEEVSIAFTKRIKEKWLSLSQQQQESLGELLLKTLGSDFIDASECYLSRAYEPRDKLELYLNDTDAMHLVSDDYLINEANSQETAEERRKNVQEWKVFFQKIGVSHEINEENIASIIVRVNTEKNAEKLIKFTLLLRTRFFDGKSLKTDSTLAEKLKKVHIVSKENHFTSAESCYLADRYNPSEPLEGAVATLRYVSGNYLNLLEENDNAKVKKWQTFFIFLGAKQKLEVAFVKDKKRTDFSTDDSNSAAYFSFLEGREYPYETEPGTKLYSSDTSRYMHQHTISAYLTIPFAEQLISTHVLWKIIKDHWSNIKSMGGVIYKTARSNRTVLSNVQVLVEKSTKRLQGKTPGELYAPFFKKQLEEEASAFPIANILADFTEAQWVFLGFRTQFTVEDCIMLLRNISTKSYGKRTDSILFFTYNRILQIITDDPTAIRFITGVDIKLLSEDNTFEQKDKLYFLTSQQLPQHSLSPQLIKNPGINHNQFTKLCEAFKISFIQDNEFTVNTSDAVVDTTIKDIILQKLPYVILEELKLIFVEPAQLIETIKQRTEEIIAKFEVLQWSSVSKLQVQYENIIAEEVELWLDSNSLSIFYEKESEPTLMSDICNILYSYLSLRFSLNPQAFFQITSKNIKKIRQTYKNNLYLKDDTCVNIILEYLQQREPVKHDASDEVKADEPSNSPTSPLEVGAEDDDEEDKTPSASSQEIKTQAFSRSTESTTPRVASTANAAFLPLRQGVKRKHTESISSSSLAAHSVSDASAQKTRKLASDFPVKTAIKQKEVQADFDIEEASDSDEDFDFSQQTQKVRNLKQTTLIQFDQFCTKAPRVGLSKKRKPPTEETKQGVGDLGEEYVYKHLKDEVFADWETTEIETGFEAIKNGEKRVITWWNKICIHGQQPGERSSLPYDFSIQHFSNIEDAEPVCTEYIETKATRGMDWRDPFFSAAELDLLYREAENYTIYYVMNVKDANNIQHTCIKNPREELKNRNLRIGGDIRLTLKS